MDEWEWDPVAVPGAPCKTVVRYDIERENPEGIPDSSSGNERWLQTRDNIFLDEA